MIESSHTLMFFLNEGVNRREVCLLSPGRGGGGETIPHWTDNTN